ncbi:MAG: hypothetical protein D6812_14235 [Deltaproteobacteria bacterium]|nr:MAG: hypothetical protein D6812_14235 [Deltaproteobacteria bacterium]
MLIGFNDEIHYRKLRLHIQTEDSGPKRARITTIILHNGAVVASKSRSYAAILQKRGIEALDESLLRELMMMQHRKMIQDIQAGKLDEALALVHP